MGCLVGAGLGAWAGPSLTARWQNSLAISHGRAMQGIPELKPVRGSSGFVSVGSFERTKEAGLPEEV